MIIIIIPCKFFKSELTGGPSVESEWYQIFSGHPDFSQYSSWSWSCILYCIPNFQSHQFLYHEHCFTQPFYYGQDVTQDQFLSRMLVV